MAAKDIQPTGGPRECEVIEGFYDDCTYETKRFWLFGFTCGDETVWIDPEPPRFCPDCGARVVAPK